MLAPDELAVIVYNCDELGVITTTDSEQLGGSVAYLLDLLPILRFDEQYLCGGTVEFVFFGSGRQFDVTVEAKGETIY